MIRLAWPILIAQLSLTAMGFVDTVMAGHYGKLDLAAIAVGSSLWLPALLFTEAVLMAITPIVAQARGRRDDEEVARAIRQGLWLALMTGLTVATMLLCAISLLQWMQIDTGMFPIAQRYLEWVACGIPCAAVYRAMRSFVEGHGQTIPVMLVNLTGLLANIPLNYWFIYGGFGVPAQGGAGCGMATALVMLLMAVIFSVYLFFGPLRVSVRSVSGWLPQWSMLRVLLAIGLPMGLAMFAEVSIFAVLALLIAPLGADSVAAHQIALNLSAQTFMLPFSLSIALSIRIAYLLGKGDGQQVRVCVRTGLSMALLSASLTAGFITLASPLIARFYTNDVAVQQLALALLVYAAVFQLPDALQACSAGILRGFKVTRTPMLYMLMAYWLIALPLGYTLALTDRLVPALGPEGLWMALLIGLSIAAVLLLYKVWRVVGAYRALPVTEV